MSTQLPSDKYYDRDFWIKENLQYAKPHFRLEKAARIINRIARTEDCDLLDVGCGPAALMGLLRKNIRYHGIDLAIQRPAPHLLQTNFIETPIGFDSKQFDIVIAQGVFEYAGTFQLQKFSEIRKLLKPGGKFIVSYVNFDHLNKYIAYFYNNVQPLREFRRSLTQVFRIERSFPTSHNWRHHEPRRALNHAIQMRINMYVPMISPYLAVEYFFICSPNDDSSSN
jgi:SAM-dependent methyltransferase